MPDNNVGLMTASAHLR